MFLFLIDSSGGGGVGRGVGGGVGGCIGGCIGAGVSRWALVGGGDGDGVGCVCRRSFRSAT